MCTVGALTFSSYWLFQWRFSWQPLHDVTGSRSCPTTLRQVSAAYSPPAVLGQLVDRQDEYERWAPWLPYPLLFANYRCIYVHDNDDITSRRFLESSKVLCSSQLIHVHYIKGVISLVWWSQTEETCCRVVAVNVVKAGYRLTTTMLSTKR